MNPAEGDAPKPGGEVGNPMPDIGAVGLAMKVEAKVEAQETEVQLPGVKKRKQPQVAPPKSEPAVELEVAPPASAKDKGKGKAKAKAMGKAKGKSTDPNFVRENSFRPPYIASWLWNKSSYVRRRSEAAAYKTPLQNQAGLKAEEEFKAAAGAGVAPPEVPPAGSSTDAVTAELAVVQKLLQRILERATDRASNEDKLVEQVLYQVGAALTAGLQPNDQTTKDNARDCIPAMPFVQPTAMPGPRTCIPTPSHHRVKIPVAPHPFPAMVAIPVGKKETAMEPKAQEPMDVEWQKLRSIRTWHESKVREWVNVKIVYPKSGKKVQIGHVFGLCVVKGEESEEDDPDRKYTGRVVFGGNNLFTENHEAALLQDLASCPASIEPGKASDAHRSAPGNDSEQADDGKQAYTQSLLKGTDTLVRLPKDHWAETRKGMKDPVCPLRLALYGHPDSGGHWERHGESHLLSVGYIPDADWKSCFWHEGLQLLLAFYVEDFKFSGPNENLKKGWESIRSKIETDEPHKIGHWLGCTHHRFEKKKNGVLVRGIEYDMEGFLSLYVGKYLKIAKESGASTKLNSVYTPFILDPGQEKEEEKYTPDVLRLVILHPAKFASA